MNAMASNGKYGEESTINDMKGKMIHYCLNTLRKRSVDEQLDDLSGIMKSRVELKISYDKSGLRVTYNVGPRNASVNGTDESTCVSQCKREVLKKLMVLCAYTNSDAQASNVLQEHRSEVHDSGVAQHAYSEIELCKGRRDAKNSLDDGVLVGRKTGVPKELQKYVDGKISPLTLKVVYSLTDWEIRYDVGPFHASAKGSTCMHRCKKHLLRELCAKVNGVNKVVRADGDGVADRHEASTSPANTSQAASLEDGNCSHGDASSVGEKSPGDRASGSAVSTTTVELAAVEEVPTGSPAGIQLGEQTRRSVNVPEAHEKYVNQATVVLRNVTRHTLFLSSKRFYGIIVQANRHNRSYTKKITDCVVTHAIDMPENCAVYAELCCNVIGNACADSRAFQLGLVQSCKDVLNKTGVFQGMETGWRLLNELQSERRFDEKTRERSIGTCRLMGEMFMRNQMFRTMDCIVKTFMLTHDAHSLECLCVLLTIIGPKLKKIIEAPRRVYEQLERYMVTGYAGNRRLPQLTVDMIETVLNLRQCCSTSWDLWQDYFAERKAVEDVDHRQLRMQNANHANGEPGPGILRSDHSSRSNNSTMRTRHRPKRVTFNPLVSILSFRRDK